VEKIGLTDHVRNEVLLRV